MNFLLDSFAWLQESLYEGVVQPIAFAAGQGHLLEKAYEGTGWLVVGLLQIAVLLVVIGPLQRQCACGCALHPDSPSGFVQAGHVFYAGCRL